MAEPISTLTRHDLEAIQSDAGHEPGLRLCLRFVFRGAYARPRLVSGKRAERCGR
jgi:hypothetical protein